MTYIMVYITTKNEEEAERIGKELVSQRLVACANVIPKIKSTYWWKGNIEQEEEAVLLLKSTEEKAQSIINRVKELHSYSVPCINVVLVTKGNKDYFRWLDESISPSRRLNDFEKIQTSKKTKS
jgi:periplasmic divalent cation tolerance protein